MSERRSTLRRHLPWRRGTGGYAFLARTGVLALVLAAPVALAQVRARAAVSPPDSKETPLELTEAPEGPAALDVSAISAIGDEPAPPKAPMVLEDTEVRVLPSRHTGVSYKLYIGLPESYDEGSRRYPVVYLLDADYSFLLARNITQHLSQRNHLEEVLLVGIAYDGPLRYRLNRTRDYTPTHTLEGGYGPELQKVSGGGEAFRRFLGEELVPFIDRSYRTRPADRTLVGHSYGGMFGTYVLLTSPELFQRYVLVSPSLWYDDHLLFEREKAYSEAHEDLSARVFYCVGSREISDRYNMVADLGTFVARLEKRGYEGLKLRHWLLEDETHNSVFPAGLGKGLRYVLEGR